jgi:hypothetical protein
MPLRLNPDEQAILRELSTPIDKGRQPEFVEAVLEAAGPAAGPGALHRGRALGLRAVLDSPAGSPSGACRA